MNHNLLLEPIGFFRSPKSSPVDAARQATADRSDSHGVIELSSGQNFEQALEQIDGFSHLWVIYGFHHNNDWKPKVDPPRGPGHKVGVFASRSPYRPNAIGISALQLVERQGLKLIVGPHDLLDGSPIYDIKPYLTHSDSIPSASKGWTEGLEAQIYELSFSLRSLEQLEFLRETGGLTEFRGSLETQLQFEPLNSQKKRVKLLSEDTAVFSLKTWRAKFQVFESERQVRIEEIFSGYNQEELHWPQDPYQDKELHRLFRKQAWK
jgi:tRNA (adenine37-N6)-methyltransferase